VHESNQKNQDPAEVSNVTNYVVGYACKGTKPLSIKKQLVKDCAISFESESGDIRDTAKIDHQIIYQQQKKDLLMETRLPITPSIFF
jgi:hypothetical protein